MTLLGLLITRGQWRAPYKGNEIFKARGCRGGEGQTHQNEARPQLHDGGPAQTRAGGKNGFPFSSHGSGSTGPRERVSLSLTLTLPAHADPSRGIKKIAQESSAFLLLGAIQLCSSCVIVVQAGVHTAKVAPLGGALSTHFRHSYLFIYLFIVSQPMGAYCCRLDMRSLCYKAFLY